MATRTRWSIALTRLPIDRNTLRNAGMRLTGRPPHACDRRHDRGGVSYGHVLRERSSTTHKCPGHRALTLRTDGRFQRYLEEVVRKAQMPVHSTRTSKPQTISDTPITSCSQV